MQIVRRIDSLRRSCRRLTDQFVIDGVAVQQCLHLGQPLRPMAGTDDTDMGVVNPAAVILVIKEGYAGERKIALPLSEFPEGPAPLPRSRARSITSGSMSNATLKNRKQPARK